VPDVPVVVWYPEGEPFGDLLFGRLAELADRVAVDTEQFVDPEGGLRRLAAMAGGPMIVGDLAWGRLTIWRELIAQCFDSPALMGHVKHIERVRITYGSRCSRVPGLMLAGWLMARLSWRLLGRSGPAEATVLRLGRPDGGEALLELRRVATAEDIAGHLASVEVLCQDLRILVDSGERHGTLMTRIQAEGRPVLHRNAPWQRLETADLLATELRLLSRDRSYEEVLHVAAGLV
jgi:glucose-6-phosphate dehydrogenase assembly protein OpcA